MSVHQLKCEPTTFAALRGGQRSFDIRRDSNFYEIGDTVDEREFVFDGVGGRYTGQNIVFTVIDIVRGPTAGLPAGMVVLGLARVVL